MSILFVIVPVFLGAAGLWTLFGALRGLAGVRSLQRSGQTTYGLVVAAHVQHSSRGSGSDRETTSRVVETIEFTTADGRRVRAVPSFSDVGMLDRSGSEVRVIYDPAEPTRCAAPVGDRIGAGGQVGRIVFSLVFLGFVAFFVLMSQSILRASPF
ncbi:MAG: DUF3592 domain-containing protein [Cellulosimicrobium cellulans]